SGVFGLLHCYLLPACERCPSPPQPLRGLPLSLCFLGNPPSAVIRVAPARSRGSSGYARSLPSFDAPGGPHALPGLGGVHLGHGRRCPAPRLVLLDVSHYSSAR